MGDSNLFCYYVDMVPLITLAPDPFFSVVEGMASQAAAVKASYNSLLEARISLSYQITYPDPLMRKSEKVAANATGGWMWMGVRSTHDSFEGTYNNGAYDWIKTDLHDTKDLVQNSIDSIFPIGTAG